MMIRMTMGCQAKIELRSTDSFFNFFPRASQCPTFEKNCHNLMSFCKWI